MISIGKCSAIPTANSVFPEPVGPEIMNLCINEPFSYFLFHFKLYIHNTFLLFMSLFSVLITASDAVIFIPFRIAMTTAPTSIGSPFSYRNRIYRQLQ